MSARLTAEDHRLRRIPEASWQSTVVDLALLLGWRVYYPPRAGVESQDSVRYVPAGWPDLTLVRGPRLLFAELKRETGRTTPAQEEWLAALTGASVETYVWKPSDFAEVRAVLAHRQETDR